VERSAKENTSESPPAHVKSYKGQYEPSPASETYTTRLSQKGRTYYPLTDRSHNIRTPLTSVAQQTYIDPGAGGNGEKAKEPRRGGGCLRCQAGGVFIGSRTTPWGGSPDTPTEHPAVSARCASTPRAPRGLFHVRHRTTILKRKDGERRNITSILWSINTREKQLKKNDTVKKGAPH